MVLHLQLYHGCSRQGAGFESAETCNRQGELSAKYCCNVYAGASYSVRRAPPVFPSTAHRTASQSELSLSSTSTVRPSVLSPDALTGTTCCSTTLPALQVPLCAPLSAQSQDHVTLLCTGSRATSSVHAVEKRLPPMLLCVGTREMRKVKGPGLGNSRYPRSHRFVGKISRFANLSL